MAETEIGKISHFFDKIMVGIIELTGPLKLGDTIHIKGSSCDFVQKIDSMQIDHKPVESAKAGDGIGVRMSEKARQNDIVYRLDN